MDKLDLKTISFKGKDLGEGCYGTVKLYNNLSKYS